MEAVKKRSSYSAKPAHPANRKSRNKEFGKRGEDAAVAYLERHGYEIVARNWSCSAGEVDIIVRDEHTIVFVEVKTRSSIECGFPEEAVTASKRARYEKIAAYFLKNYECSDLAVRFDVVALVVISSHRALVRHHINAFQVN